MLNISMKWESMLDNLGVDTSCLVNPQGHSFKKGPLYISFNEIDFKFVVWHPIDMDEAVGVEIVARTQADNTVAIYYLIRSPGKGVNEAKEHDFPERLFEMCSDRYVSDVILRGLGFPEDNRDRD